MMRVPRGCLTCVLAYISRMVMNSVGLLRAKLGMSSTSSSF